MADNIVDDLVEEYNEGKQYQLDEYETAFIKELDALLVYHSYRQRILTNLLTYICRVKFGYDKIREGYDLQYNIETDTEPYKLRVKEVKREA